MARPLRLLVENGVYHVTARGNDRTPIYRTDGDRMSFLSILTRCVARLRWRCLTYCLMDNHFHLLLQTPEPNLMRGMQQLNGSYAQSFNRRHGRTGALFDRRYGAVLVEQDSHVLEVFRYIAHNPVRAGLCAAPSDWLWSGHAAIAGEHEAPPFLAVGAAREWFAAASGVAGATAYANFVTDGCADAASPSPDGVVLGSREFVAQTLEHVPSHPEIPRSHWGAGRPALRELLVGDDVDGLIAAAYTRYGYTLASIAAELRCHVSTVSRRLRKYEARTLECKI